MKLLKQFALILLFCCIGEIIKYFVPLPIPANIYGLVLLFLALLTGVVKLDQIRQVAGYLIEIMPLMFIPAGVGLMKCFDTLKSIWLPLLVTVLATTVLVMGVSGRVTQWLIRFTKKEAEDHE